MIPTRLAPSSVQQKFQLFRLWKHKARALARGMKLATYPGVLLRSHLQRLSPLPKDELLALRRAVSELGALTRELHRIALALGQQSRPAAPEQPDLRRLAMATLSGCRQTI